MNINYGYLFKTIVAKKLCTSIQGELQKKNTNNYVS